MTNPLKKLAAFAAMKILNATGWTSARWGGVFGSFANAAKETVNNETALTVSTVFAATRNIAEDIAKLPLPVYRKDGESRLKDNVHPLNRVLNYQSNPLMTAITFRNTMQAQMILWGNAFSEIQRDIDGNVIALFPLRPDRVVMELDANGELWYRVTSNKGESSYLHSRHVLHIPGLGGDGLSGYNIIQLMSQSIGAAIGMEKTAASFFGNGLHPSGNLEHPGNLSKPAMDRIREQIDREHGGGSNKNRLLILEEGMKFTASTMDPKASQMIETRQFTVGEFCRWLRIPPHKVADLSRATFSNIEQQNIDYVTDSLTGWAERWEQAIWSKLFTEQEQREGYFVEHKFEALLRGDTKTRYEAYGTLWDRGIFSINEIRAMENMNPIDSGNKHYVPLNFTTTDAAPAPLAESVANDISNRVLKNQTDSLRAAMDKHGDKFSLETYVENHADKQRKYIESVIKPFTR